MKVFVRVVAQEEKRLLKWDIVNDLTAETVLNFYPDYEYAAIVEADSPEEALAAIIMKGKVVEAIKEVPVYRVLKVEKAKKESLTEEDKRKAIEEAEKEEKKAKKGS